MKVKINLNDKVKVKLTDYGIMLLKKRHDELNKKIKDSGGKGNTFELILDENGYYETQLWSLMEKFGAHCGLAKENPFEIDIIIEN
jgi:hypothetical protein